MELWCRKRRLDLIHLSTTVGPKPIGNFALFCTKKGTKGALKARAAKPLWPSSSFYRRPYYRLTIAPFKSTFLLGKVRKKRRIYCDTEEWHDLYCDQYKRAKECNWLLPSLLLCQGKYVTSVTHIFHLKSRTFGSWGGRTQKSSITHSYYCCYNVVKKTGKCIRFLSSSFLFLSPRYVTTVWSNKRGTLDASFLNGNFWILRTVLPEWLISACYSHFQSSESHIRDTDHVFQRLSQFWQQRSIDESEEIGDFSSSFSFMYSLQQGQKPWFWRILRVSRHNF